VQASGKVSPHDLDLLTLTDDLDEVVSLMVEARLGHAPTVHPRQPE